MRKYRMLPLVATANQQHWPLKSSFSPYMNTKCKLPHNLIEYIESFCTFLHGYACVKLTVVAFLYDDENCHSGCNSLDQVPEPQGNECVIEAQLGGNSLTAVQLKRELFLEASRRDPPGLYSSLAALIWISVSAAIWSFWVTSSAVCLVLPRTTIRLSSSTSEPCQETVNWRSTFALQGFFLCISSGWNEQECSCSEIPQN